MFLCNFILQSRKNVTSSYYASVFKRTTRQNNTKLNDFRNIILFEKIFLLKEFQFMKSSAMLHQIFNDFCHHVCHASPNFQWLYCLPCSIKFSMTLYCLPGFYMNDVIDMLPQQLRNCQCFTKPLGRMSSRWHNFNISLTNSCYDDKSMMSLIQEHGRPIFQWHL